MLNGLFYQDRLGTNIEKALKKRDAFFPVESFPDAIHQKNLVGGAKNTPPLFEQIYT
jgi:hypothetical protein